MKNLKLGILGCGGAALTIHLPVLYRLNDKFSLYAVCDQIPERAAQASKRFGIEKVFSCLDDMLEESFDVLVILALNHEKPIEKGIEAKKHIFTEKPISLDLAASYSLKERAKKAQINLEVGLMRFYDPLMEKLLLEISPLSIHTGFFYKYDGLDAFLRKSLLPPAMEIYTFHHDEPPQVPGKFNEEQLFVLKTLLWSGIHHLSALIQLFEEVKTISCRVDKNRSSIYCLFETKIGQHVALNIGSTALPLYEEEIILFGENQKARIEFSSPYLNIPQSKLILTTMKNGELYTNLSTTYETAFQKMWENMYYSIQMSAPKKENSYLNRALKVEALAHQAAQIAITSQGVL